MQLSVAEFADRMNLSPRRVQAMIIDGRLPAEKVGGRYVISDRELSYEPRLGRSMSPRMAWAFLGHLAGVADPTLSATERGRLSTRANRLQDSAEPARLLRSWLNQRARREVLRMDARDVAEALADSRLHPSGISHALSGLSAANEAEGYVVERDFQALRGDFLMVRDPASNVFLHVVDRAPTSEVLDSLGVLAADLADHVGPREDGRVREIVRSL